MVSNNGPPLPMPMQVPPGHMVQQIVDENGYLTHVILSPQPAGMAAPAPPPPMTVGYYVRTCFFFLLPPHSFTYTLTEAVFHYCCPDCPSCLAPSLTHTLRLYFFIAAQIAHVPLAHLNSIGWATWTIWVAIKKYNPRAYRIEACRFLACVVVSYSNVLVA